MAARQSSGTAPGCPQQAQAEFVESYAELRADLLRWVRRSFGLRDAEEITDETLARAFAALPRLDLDRPLEPWLRVVARRLAGEVRERHRRCDAWADVYEALDEAPSADPDPALLIEDEERRTRLARMLAGPLMGVSAAQRHVLLMRAVDELSFSEIAQRLGTTEAAVRQQLTKACKRLRRAITNDGGWTPALAAPVVAVLRRLRLRYRPATHLRAAAESPTVALATVVCSGLVCVVGYAGLTGHGGAGSTRSTATVPSTAAVSVAPTSPSGAPDDWRRARVAYRPVSPARPSVVGAAPAVPVRVTKAVAKKPLDHGTQVEVDVVVDAPVVGRNEVYVSLLRSGGNEGSPACSVPGVPCK